MVHTPTHVTLTHANTRDHTLSGAGWQIGKNGLPKLPLTSVLAVVGVGAVILEAASHAPV